MPLDKYSILEIKLKCITDTSKRYEVEKEMKLLEPSVNPSIYKKPHTTINVC